LPGITRSAWVIKKADILKTNSTATEKTFHYRLKRKEYYEEFGKDRERPNFGQRVLALVIDILPKVGPLRSLKFKDPGPEGEKLFIESFDTTVVHYTIALNMLKQQNSIHMPNIDFDTGKETAPGEYGLADQTYSELIIKLKDEKFTELTRPLKNNILNFYSKGDTTTKSNEHKKDKVNWQKTYMALQEIKITNAISLDSLNYP